MAFWYNLGTSEIVQEYHFLLAAIPFVLGQGLPCENKAEGRDLDMVLNSPSYILIKHASLITQGIF